METTSVTVHGNTLARQIRDALMDRILNGQLPPGYRLKDNEVAAMFGTSNTPVREAVRLLARDGLVEILPYRGCVVRSLDWQEIADIFDVRMLLEAYAARIAASRVSDEQLLEMQAVVAEYDEAIAAREWERANKAAGRFHQLLIDAAGNGVLTDIHQHLASRARIVRRLYLREGLTDGIPYHMLLAALRAGDGARAEALVSHYLALVKQRVCEVLQAHAEPSGSKPSVP